MMQSEEHKKAVKIVCDYFVGEEIISGKRMNSSVPNSKKKKYYPDVITQEYDFEIETTPTIKHIKEKAEKWENGKKKVLVLTLSKAKDYFNEIYIINKKGDLIRIDT